MSIECESGHHDSADDESDVEWRGLGLMCAVCYEAIGDTRSLRILVEGLREKIVEMELHDDLPDSYDLGYMAAWKELKEVLEAPSQ